jgi:hypothetical protein
MEALNRSAHAGRGAECALDPRLLDLEAPSIAVVKRATVTTWLGRLAYGGMLGLLFALGLGVVAAHSGMR